jgi:hypothetical protein
MRAARLGHPNIVTAQLPSLEGLLAFAMGTWTGPTVHQLVRRAGALPVSNACYYVYQAAGIAARLRPQDVIATSAPT